MNLVFVEKGSGEFVQGRIVDIGLDGSVYISWVDEGWSGHYGITADFETFWENVAIICSAL